MFTILRLKKHTLCQEYLFMYFVFFLFLDDLTKEQKDFFINYYCTLSKLGLPDAKKTDLGLPVSDLFSPNSRG